MNKILMILTAFIFLTLGVCAQGGPKTHPFAFDEKIDRIISRFGEWQPSVLESFYKKYREDPTFIVAMLGITVESNVLTFRFMCNNRKGDLFLMEFSGGVGSPGFYDGKNNADYPFALTDEAKDAFAEISKVRYCVKDRNTIDAQLAPFYEKYNKLGKKFLIFGVIETKTAKEIKYDFLAAENEVLGLAPYTFIMSKSDAAACL